MKVLVPVKRVVDYNVKVRVKSDGSGVELANVKMSMNPFDEIAVEEALRLREAGKATEVVVASIGPAQASETIRTGLAMGADRGILVKAEGNVEPLAVAKILKAIADEEKPGLIILGKQAIEADTTQTGQVRGGLQTRNPRARPIVRPGRRLKEPRDASLPNIMKAKKKPIADKSASDYGVDLTAHLEILKTSEPPGRKGGVKVKDVAELVSKLKNEAGVL